MIVFVDDLLKPALELLQALLFDELLLQVHLKIGKVGTLLSFSERVVRYLTFLNAISPLQKD